LLFYSLCADRISGLLGNNKASGLQAIEVGALLKAYDKFDITGMLSLEGIGFEKTVIFALSPGIVYHWDNQFDIAGGVHVGIAGGEAIGNNFHLSVARRF